MFGKVFAAMYEGSMYGAGPDVFALWPYIIANADRKGVVMLNPDSVGDRLGMPAKTVVKVLTQFTQPDPRSQSKEASGRKLEKLGEFTYRIVNYEKYRNIRTAEDRRESNRMAQARYRAKSKPSPGEVAAVKQYEETGQME